MDPGHLTPAVRCSTTGAPTRLAPAPFAALKQAIVDGHDGAHPHLPRLTSERAAVLFELMKDVLYQLFVRRSKIKEAMQLRRAAIENAG